MDCSNGGVTGACVTGVVTADVGCAVVGTGVGARNQKKKINIHKNIILTSSLEYASISSIIM